MLPAQAGEDNERGDGEDDRPDEEDNDRHLPSLAEKVKVLKHKK